MINRTLWSYNAESRIKYESDFLSERMSSFPGGFDGNKFTADLQVQGFSDKTLRVKINNPQFIVKNQRIGLTEAAEILDILLLISGMERNNRPENIHDFTTHIMVPMLLQFKKGQVRTLITSQDEPSSVTDIKKQIALQLEENKPSNHLQLMKRQQILNVLPMPFSPKAVKVKITQYSTFFFRSIYFVCFR